MIILLWFPSPEIECNLSSSTRRDLPCARRTRVHLSGRGPNNNNTQSSSQHNRIEVGRGVMLLQSSVR